MTVTTCIIDGWVGDLQNPHTKIILDVYLHTVNAEKTGVTSRFYNNCVQRWGYMMMYTKKNCNSNIWMLENKS